MSKEGLILTSGQVKVLLSLILIIWIITFFLGISIGKYVSIDKKQTIDQEVTKPAKDEKPKEEANTKTEAAKPAPTENFYTIVVGWESTEARAVKIRERYESKDIKSVLVVENPGDNKVKYRITVGRFVDKKDARKVSKELKAKKKIPQDSWILYVKM